jgi:hypothetical protein
LNTHHHKRSHRYRRYKSRRKHFPKDICPVCNKPINKILTAIVHRDTGRKAHFDCIINEIKKSYPLKQREEVCYLGGGSFGIIEESKGNRAKGFIIKKRIQYEER